MFNDTVAKAIVAAANDAGIQPAALLAIVEVETGGKTFEVDGRTPQFLYERHVAWREATKIGQGILNAFRRAGLAIPHWDRATQYKDQRSSAMRLQLIGRARAIHEEVADRSASWGLGQTMGNLAESLGFPNAVAMVEHMTGSVSGQIDCMVRELKHTNLVKSLNAHDWTRVARVYNGPGYAANKYDAKLADAFARWSRKLPQLSEPAPPEQSLAEDEIREIQDKLRALGFYEVGMSDGHWNTKTTGAWSAFQAHAGLRVTGHYDAESKAAFEAAEVPREVSPERAEATADDLRAMGSDTIAHADNVTWLGRVKQGLGLTVASGAGAEQMGLLDKAQNAIDKGEQAKGIWESVHGYLAPLLDRPELLIFGVAVFALGCAACYIAERIRENRTADHNSGVHAGPEA